MLDKEIVEKITDSILQLQKENPPLQIGASERSFSHRLAVHFEKHFCDWNIDCEYNRKGNIKKELHGIHECEEIRKTDLVYPDIIIHKRNNNENLLIIEMKHCSTEDLCDKRKLELFTSLTGNYKYKLGLYINMAKSGDFEKTWYKDGACVLEKVLIS